MFVKTSQILPKAESFPVYVFDSGEIITFSKEEPTLIDI